MRVLIAEDDSDIRSVYETMVTAWGFEVTSVPDGQEAWAAIQHDAPPMIALIDWMIPRKDGLEFCRNVRARLNGPFIYIIVITSKSDPGDAVAALEAGADDFLRKPIDQDELRARVMVGRRTVERHMMHEDRSRELNERNVYIGHYARQMEKLALERGIFHRAFKDSMQGMFILNPEGFVTHVNEAVTRRYGYSEKDLVGETPWVLAAGRDEYTDLGVSFDEYQKIFADLWNAVIDPEIDSWEGVIANRAKDGSIVHVQLFINAIIDGAQNIIGYLGTPVDITNRVEEEFRIRLECYRAITTVAEARDSDTGMHLRRVSDLCRALAREMSRPRKFIEDMGTFSPFHDIGKVGIPDNILLAPRRLSDEEFAVMQRHPQLGYEMLKGRATLEMAAEIALTHHEKFDGTGYPQGLAGEGIPLSGRIISVVDVYDALRSQRPYKPPWDHGRTMEFVREQSGRHFDPEVVEAFCNIEKDLEKTFDESFDQENESQIVCASHRAPDGPGQ